MNTSVYMQQSGFCGTPANPSKQIEDIRLHYTDKQVSFYKADFVRLHQRKCEAVCRVLLPVDRGVREAGGEQSEGGGVRRTRDGLEMARAAERTHDIICVPSSVFLPIGCLISLTLMQQRLSLLLLNSG